MMIFGPISLLFWIYATVYELVMGVIAPAEPKATKMVNGVSGTQY
jgi:hypothetical protein